MQNSVKIRIKVGAMEVEYEGEPSFLKDGLESLLTNIAELSTQLQPEPQTKSNAPNKPPTPSSSNGMDLSTSTIAAHFDAKSATELAVCALAKLELIDNKSGVKRSDILEEMKSANAYYNKNMATNLSKSLTTLTKNKRANHGANDSYSLSANERKSIEVKIANIA